MAFDRLGYLDPDEAPKPVSIIEACQRHK